MDARTSILCAGMVATMTLCETLAAHFAAHPNTWIDGLALGKVAGSYAWRSRLSELRFAPFNMRIDNRQRKIQPDLLSARTVTVSEYRFVP